MINLWGGTVDDETCSAIGHFSIIWAQFENYFFNNNYNANSSKGIIVRASESISKELINNIKNALVKYGEETNPEGCDWLAKLSVRDNEPHYNQLIQGFLDGDSLCKEYQILACIYIAARIRNNLLHGIKDVFTLDKQVEIFKSLYDFLQALIVNYAISVC